MKARTLLWRGALTSVLLSLSGGIAEASVVCVQTYLASSDRTSLGISPQDIDLLVAQVAKAIGLTPTGIMAVPCHGPLKVYTDYFDKPDVPKGEYIFYDPDWVREVVGTKLKNTPGRREYDEAIVLFGHELGHLLDRDFTTNKGLSRIQKETNADRFAGCAAAGLNVRWQSVEDFLGRIRGDVDSTYPSRTKSLAAAREGYDACRRTPPNALEGKKILGTKRSFCNDLKLIASLAPDSFLAIRGDASSDGKNWGTTAYLSGFEGCVITQDKFTNYTCRMQNVLSKEGDLSLYTKNKNMIRGCLDKAWTQNDMDAKVSFFSNVSSSVTIMYTSNNSFTMDGSPSFLHNLAVYDSSIVNESNASAPKAEFVLSKPEGYCDTLKEYARSADNAFSELVRNTNKEQGSHGVRKQLNGWNGCDIRSLEPDGTRKYALCELGPFGKAEDADQMVSSLQADVAQCLGSDWDVVRKRRYDGITKFVFSHPASSTTIEVRKAQDLDDLWQVRLDVNEGTAN